MSDDRYVYFDEDGNEIDPSQLDDFEIVDDDPADPGPAPQAPAPAAPQPAGSGGVPKGLIAGVAVAAVVLLGGGAWAAQKIGSQNTVEDVKVAAEEKKAEVSESAEEKREEVTRPPLDACTDLSKAMWSGTEAPAVQLSVTDAAALPVGMVQRMAAIDLETSGFGMQQISRDVWGVYAPAPADDPDAGWWRVEAVVDDGIAMTEGPMDGREYEVVGACPEAKAGAYRIAGDVPDEARGLKDEQVVASAIRADGADETRVVAVVGDQLVSMDLEYAPDDDSEDADES